MPSFGFNTREGFKYKQSFFWAIADNQDLTPTFDYRGKLGVGGDLEYRYVINSRSQGILGGSIFDDHDIDEVRINGNIAHTQDLTDELQIKAHGQFVNLVDTFRQLSNITEERTLRSIESNLIIAQRWPNAYLYMLARYTKDLTGDNDRTIHRLPEVGYKLRDYRLAGLPLFASLDATADNFWCVQSNPCGVTVQPGVIDGVKVFRVDAYPRLTARINLWDAAMLTPEAGYRELFYTRSISSSEPFQRGSYLFRVNLVSPMIRSYLYSPESGAGRLIHHVEPAVLYEYVQGIDSVDVPQMDQVDAFPQKNLITYSVTNRLVLKRPGEGGTIGRLEFFYLKLTQSYGRERMTGFPDQRPFSDLRGEMILRAGRRISLDVDSFLSVYDPNRFTTIDADLKFDWKKIFLLYVGERFTRAGTRPLKGDLLEPYSLGVQQIQAENLKFITAGAAVNIASRVSLAGKMFYDYEREKLAEGRAAVRYTGSCNCWGLTLSYFYFQQTGAGSTSVGSKNEFSFSFTITGLTNTESGAVRKLFEPLD
jgi:LPS-assembly protein